MAVLNKIRQRSVFLIIIIALALFSFVLADVIRNGGFSSRKSKSTVAVVNGEDIERQEFAMQVEAFQQNMRRQMTSLQAAKQVWNAQIQDILLQQQAEELGIQVGENQINQILQRQFAGNPNFSNENGVFDPAVLQEYVANLRATSPEAYKKWLTFENNVATAAKANIYFNMIRAGIGATLFEGKQAYEMKAEQVDIKYVKVPYSSIKEVEISENKIKAYVKAHPESYKAESSRDLAYVLFEEKPSEEDKKEVKKELVSLLSPHVVYNSVTKENDTIPGFKATENNKEFVNINSDLKFQDRFFFKKDLPKEISEAIFKLEEGEIYGPYELNNSWNATKVVGIKQLADSAKASHILISYKGLRTGVGLTRSKEEAKNLADSLLTVVQNNPDKFAEIAAEFSADTANKDKAGDLGWFSYGNMVPAFNTFVFSHDKGDMGVVETNFGFHIASVQEKSDTQKAVKLATLSRKVSASEKTINDLYATATNFQLNATKNGFSETAKQENTPVRYAKGLKILDENIPGIGLKRDIVKWTFEEGLQVGTIKRFDTNNGYAIVQLTEKQPKGLMNVSKASLTALPILKKEAKAKIIKEKITGTTLSEIAASTQTSVQSASNLNLENPIITSAKEPLVVGAAFSLKKGEITNPIAGETGVYVAKLVERTKAPELPSYAAMAKKETQKRVSRAIPPRGNGRVIKALKETAEIKDNRANFY